MRSTNGLKAGRWAKNKLLLLLLIVLSSCLNESVISGSWQNTYVVPNSTSSPRCLKIASSYVTSCLRNQIEFIMEFDLEGMGLITECQKFINFAFLFD